MLLPALSQLPAVAVLKLLVASLELLSPGAPRRVLQQQQRQQQSFRALLLLAMRAAEVAAQRHASQLQQHQLLLLLRGIAYLAATAIPATATAAAADNTNSTSEQQHQEVMALRLFAPRLAFVSNHYSCRVAAVAATAKAKAASADTVASIGAETAACSSSDYCNKSSNLDIIPLRLIVFLLRLQGAASPRCVGTWRYRGDFCCSRSI